MSTPFNDQWRLRQAPPPRPPARTVDAYLTQHASGGQAQSAPPPREPAAQPRRVGLAVHLGKRPRWIDRDT